MWMTAHNIASAHLLEYQTRHLPNAFCRHYIHPSGPRYEYLLKAARSFHVTFHGYWLVPWAS
jgi:hypothetical protein